ncbi:MAG: glyoxalase superfamily protein [Pseudomonadota bacterium]
MLTSHTSLPDVDDLKRQAKRLRSHLDGQGQTMTHSASLEAIAHQYGFRDWNTLSAAARRSQVARTGLRDMSGDYQIGAWMRGAYMGQDFTGEIIAAQMLNSGQFRLTIRFDKPVDVVEFESFSAFRKQVTCVMNASGVSVKKRSDGVPHMALV